MLVYTSINDKYTRLIIEGYVISTPGKFRNKIGPLDAGANLQDFGNIFLGTIGNEIITIFNSTEDTIYITPQNTFDYIELSVEPQILEPGQSGEITIKFSTTQRELGRSITECDFEIIKKEEKYTGKLSIIANIVEDFSILTEWESANLPIIFTAFNKIDLGSIEPNKLTMKNIEIENLGKRELIIHNITTTNSMYSIHPSKQKIKPGEKGTFQLSIIPTIKRNNIASKLTIISNDPSKSVISFTIIGKVDMPKVSSNKNMTGDIQIEKAAKLLQSFKGNDEFVILDVRTIDEYNNGCIEDAVNVDYNNPNFKSMIKLMDKQKTYLVYCRSGIRSKNAVELMRGMGFRKIYHMNEGIEGWKVQRLELVNPK